MASSDSSATALLPSSALSLGPYLARRRCRSSWQSSKIKQQDEVASERRLILRIGINLGAVVPEEDDVLGDGVNVAARLEQICHPGGVLIRVQPTSQLHGKLDLPFAYIGEQHLKHRRDRSGPINSSWSGTSWSAVNCADGSARSLHSR